jgi:hypothetical protein
MRIFAQRLLFWTPRCLALFFALFLSAFALDVFAESRGFWRTALSFLIHLLPAALMIVVLLIAWRWERLGGTLFLVFGVLALVPLWSNGESWMPTLILAAPPLLIGLLFLLDWHFRAESPGNDKVG